eukprot:m.143199 g.143199  ORF g.143199 m.143199 type:complete len:170 (-) comp59187_c0_seq1:146-655(-)
MSNGRKAKKEEIGEGKCDQLDHDNDDLPEVPNVPLVVSRLESKFVNSFRPTMSTNDITNEPNVVSHSKAASSPCSMMVRGKTDDTDRKQPVATAASKLQLLHFLGDPTSSFLQPTPTNNTLRSASSPQSMSRKRSLLGAVSGSKLLLKIHALQRQVDDTVNARKRALVQ